MEITNRHSAAEAANQVALTPAVAVDPMNALGFEEWLARREPLAGRDLEKWQDFVADSAPGRCSKHSPLAWVFYRFKKLLGAGGVTEPAFPPRSAAFSVDILRAQADHFDRLAAHYGDLYRGSVIVNYMLGILAIWFALLPAISGVGDGLIPVVCAVAEFSCLVVMSLLFWRGRSPHLHSAGAESSSSGRWLNQRWHERWLEYRGLAERFRYADLLRLLRVNTAIGAHGPADTEGEDWASRYFAWRMSDVTWPAHPAIDDAHNLLALLHGQQVYHHANEERCDRISRRLHWIIGLVFFISLAGAVLELVELWPKLFNAQGELRWGLCGAGFGGFDQACLARKPTAHPLIFFTAALPALAAALYGIHSSCEFAKLARNSRDMARALDQLRMQAEQLIDRDPRLTHGERNLKRLISRFLHLCTDEATGWHEMLWDKNVPLG